MLINVHKLIQSTFKIMHNDHLKEVKCFALSVAFSPSRRRQTETERVAFPEDVSIHLKIFQYVE